MRHFKRLSPSNTSKRVWHLRTILDAEAVWMLRYIRRGEADKAAKKALAAATIGNVILALLEKHDEGYIHRD